MRKIKYIVISIVFALIIDSTLSAQNDFTYNFIGKRFLIKNLSIHTDSLMIKFSIIDDDVVIKPNPMLTYYWHKNRTIRSNQGGVGGDLLEGSYMVFDNNDNLIEQGYFHKGLKYGEWIKWNNKGELIYIKKYKKGQLHGKSIEYTDETIKIKYRRNKLINSSKDNNE